MSLPKAVQEAEARANAMIEAQANGNTEQSIPDTRNPSSLPGTNETPEPQTSEARGNDDGYKHKYDVLQGKFNKLAADFKTLQQQATQPASPVSVESDPRFVQMQQQLTAMQQQNSQLTQALKDRPEPEAQVELDAFLVEEYGEEFAKSVAQSAQKQTSAAVEQLRKEFGQQIESTQNTVTQVTASNTMAALRRTLGASSVDFDSVNDDPDFHAYLAQVEPYSGIQRQQLLESAFNSGDIERTARFYTDFSKTQTTPVSNHPLADHVDPSTTVTMQDSVAQPPSFDTNALTNLHDRFRRGLITEAEFQKQEAQLFAALA